MYQTRFYARDRKSLALLISLAEITPGAKRTRNDDQTHCMTDVRTGAVGDPGKVSFIQSVVLRQKNNSIGGRAAIDHEKSFSPFAQPKDCPAMSGVCFCHLSQLIT